MNFISWEKMLLNMKSFYLFLKCSKALGCTKISFDSETKIRFLYLYHLATKRNSKKILLWRARRPITLTKSNFESEDYSDIINWHCTIITEPLLISTLNKEDIEMTAESATSAWKEFNIPLHTKAHERTVKLLNMFGVLKKETVS